jgi:hypothetical protein
LLLGLAHRRLGGIDLFLLRTAHELL